MLISCQKNLPEPVAVSGVSLNAESVELKEGENVQLIATVSPKNADNKEVIWSSSNLSIATVEDGKVTALKEGVATITVKTDDGGKTATCKVTVKAKVFPVESVTLDKTSMQVTEGDEFTLKATVKPENATNRNISWSSSNTAVATVEDGKVTALKEGVATITVKTDDGGKTATCEVTVNAKVFPVESVTLDKTSMQMTEGDEFTLKATVKPDNATNKTISWSSSNTAVATVADGKVTAIKEGKATITVKTDDGGKTATCEVTVKARPKAEALEISFTNTSGTFGGDLYIDSNYDFAVTVTPEDALAEFEWSVENEDIATITGNNNTARIKTKDYGRTAVVVTDKISGISKRYEISTCVTNFKFTEKSNDTSYGLPVLTLTVGEQHQISCSYSPQYATKVFQYLEAFKFREIYEPLNTYVIVSKPSTVEIDENGMITAKNVGTTMMETLGSGVYDYPNSSSGVFIRVKEKYIPVTNVSLSKTSAQLKVGEELTLTATISPSDATNKNITWYSSDNSIASVSDGTVRTYKAGDVTITAITEDGGKTATCQITVTEPTKATSLTLSDHSINGYIYRDHSRFYEISVSAYPENAVTDYEWTSSDKRVAKVSGYGSSAYIYTEDYGESIITVTDRRTGLSASMTIHTLVEDFAWKEESDETMYGYPMISILLGEEHKLKYSQNPSFATKIFSDLDQFVFYENNYVVDTPSYISITDDGVVKGIKAGIIGIKPTGLILKAPGTERIYINVISEYTESEYNDEMAYADVIKSGQKMKFCISNSNDIDIFKFTPPVDTFEYFDIKITYEGDLGTPNDKDKHVRYEIYNNNVEIFNSGDITFKSEGSVYTLEKRFLNTAQGYIRFYIKDYWKAYPSVIPTGDFTIEFIPR